jgi:hypothetical protein
MEGSDGGLGNQANPAALEALKKSQASLLEQITSVQKELNQTKVQAFIAESVASRPEWQQDFIRADLVSCSSLEECKEVLPKIIEKLDGVVAKARETSPGRGQSILMHESKPAQKKGKYTDEQRRQMQLAGITIKE